MYKREELEKALSEASSYELYTTFRGLVINEEEEEKQASDVINLLEKTASERDVSLEAMLAAYELTYGPVIAKAADEEDFEWRLGKLCEEIGIDRDTFDAVLAAGIMKRLEQENLVE